MIPKTPAQRRYDVACIRARQHAEHLAYAIAAWQATHGPKRAGRRLTVRAWIADLGLAQTTLREAWIALCREEIPKPAGVPLPPVTAHVAPSESASDRGAFTKEAA